MSRRKWTLVIFLVFVCPFVYSRPSQEITPSIVPSSITTESPSRSTVEKSTELTTSTSSTAAQTNSPRDVKTKVPILGDSIKMVANQLLQNFSNSSESTIVSDTRIPPKLKTQLAHKHSTKTRQDDAEIEYSHAGVAVPVTLEELESENKIIETPNESSTSNEGISTWILLSNPTNKDSKLISSTEATKPEETTKKSKPANKNKTKRPTQNSNKSKRPIIGSTNKSDLIAGGSAINENVFNKIKATVLSNVQKNKNNNKSTPTSTTTTTTTTTPPETTLKEVSTKPPTTVSVAKVSSKTSKKKNKIKNKVSSTLAPTISDSALLPMEPKVQEIELEISTPATTTKKPKRSSTKKKKKNKTKKKNTKPAVDSAVSESKVSNKTKSAKPSTKKPTAKNPITSQIYNYLSREVMPSVGVGIVGLAGLVGLAGYFLYPFSTPVRRTFEVDKKDDLYRHNAEEYATEGNGQAEEEMLGTVLAGMPAHAKNKFNPYLAQTANRFPVKKEKENQNIRYRQVPNKGYDTSSYNTPYQQNYQQKTGLAHGAVYPEPVNYNQYDNRHAYTVDNKYQYESKNAYTYPAVEPIYAAPQTGPAVVTSYGNEPSQSVVYGVKPTQDTEFKPVYPYEGQVYSETTSQPAYPSTSMYLGSNNESEIGDESEVKYDENGNSDIDKFVVGNVPKEFSDNVTPAIVPEHGPRKLSRRRRSITSRKRSIVGSIEDILKAAKAGKHNELSNEIDEALGITKINTEPQSTTESTTTENISKPAEIKKEEQTTVFPIYAVSADDNKKDEPIFREEIVESISTLPIQSGKDENPTTEPQMSNELEDTTKPFRVYEIFTTVNPSVTNEDQKELLTEVMESTTEGRKENTETTTDIKSDTTTIAPSVSPSGNTKGPTEPTFTTRPKPTLDPNVITYPPYNEEGSFFTFIKRLLEFKYRLGLSILQTTSESLNRYLRSMESTVNNVAKASKY